MRSSSRTSCAGLLMAPWSGPNPESLAATALTRTFPDIPRPSHRPRKFSRICDGGDAMNRKRRVFRALMLAGLGASGLAFAQQPAPPAQLAGQPAAPPPMSFFVTSVGKGDGANLGGLAGADAHCQTLAAAAGAGSRQWRAYLSASASGGQAAVNARDRIGQGP